MTAKPSQRGNDDSEVLKFKDFQGRVATLKGFVCIFLFLSCCW